MILDVHTLIINKIFEVQSSLYQRWLTSCLKLSNNVNHGKMNPFLGLELPLIHHNYLCYYVSKRKFIYLLYHLVIIKVRTYRPWSNVTFLGIELVGSIMCRCKIYSVQW